MARARAKINIREKGVTAAVEKLRAVGAAAHDQGVTMDELARDAPEAISRVPVDSGRLSDSLKVNGPEQYKNVTMYGYDIGTKVPYARFVFRDRKGRKGTPPRVSRKRLQDAAASAIAADIIRAD